MSYSKGYEKLVDAVKRDCNKGSGCFSENGCKDENCECFQNYCKKFKWIIDRAKHYEEKLGIPWMEILDSWEEDRDYWYMNYYQESSQPLIDSNNVYVFESAEEMREKVGKEFICPMCKGISTDPYECNSGIVRDMKSGKKCDWKSYGFLRVKLTYLYCKKERKGTHCFMPKALLKEDKERVNK